MTVERNEEEASGGHNGYRWHINGDAEPAKKDQLWREYTVLPMASCPLNARHGPATYQVDVSVGKYIIRL